jgi:hypothetical protein
MTVFGIALRKPTFNEVTAAALLGIGLWMTGLGIAHAGGHSLEMRDAGALLLVSTWACIAVRIGLGADQGGRHLAVNVVVITVLLGLYEGAVALAA